MESKLIWFVTFLSIHANHNCHGQQPNGGQPKVWLTVSSMVDKIRINGVKYITQRKLELNWLNVPTSGPLHTIALFDHDPIASNPTKLIPSSDNALVSLQPKLVAKGRFRSDIQFPIKIFTPSNLSSECLGYHIVLWNEEDGIKAQNCLKAHPFWMRDNYDHIKDKVIKDIMIPGSHNAGSYEIGYSLDTRSIIKKYVICHDESVFNQLAYGIRYLDLRVSHEPVIGKKERLWIVHGILRTEIALSEILSQVRSFLDATTHEIVILDFHRFEKGFEDYPRDEMANLLTKIRHQEVYRMLEQHLAPHISRDYVGYNVKVSDLIRDGKRLVIGYSGNRFIRDANYYPRVRHLWAEAENITSLEDYFHRMICAPSGFEATSVMAQLTPTTWGVIFDKYGGLRKMAQDVNWIVTNWFEEKWWTCVNIVASDFFLGNNLIEISIEANKRRPTVPMRRFKRSDFEDGYLSDESVFSDRIIDGQLVSDGFITDDLIGEESINESDFISGDLIGEQSTIYQEFLSNFEPLINSSDFNPSHHSIWD